MIIGRQDADQTQRYSGLPCFKSVVLRGTQDTESNT